MNNKYITYVAVVITIVAVLSATFLYANDSGQISNLQNQVKNLKDTVAAQQSELDGYQNQSSTQQNITLVDDEGYVTTLPSIPQRIISVAPSNTQILFAIGVGDKVVGVTDYDNYPYNFTAWIESGNMTSIGGYQTPNTEAIELLHPDLILCDNINDALIPTWRSLGLKVLAVNPTSINGIYKDIALVGTATGAEANATSLIANLTIRINEIEQKIANANETTKPMVYYELWYNPFISAGSTSFINDVITAAGGINIFANETQQYPTVSSETIVQLNPDVILLPTNMGAGTFYGSVDQVKERPGWNTISAVQNNRIYVIDQDLFSEPGPRIADQIQTIAAVLYPNLFNSTS